MNLGRVLWPRLGSIPSRLSTCQTRVLSNTGYTVRRTERSSCNQSYCSAILTRYVSCVCCRRGILESLSYLGDGSWKRLGRRKERSFFFFFFKKRSSKHEEKSCKADEEIEWGKRTNVEGRGGKVDGKVKTERRWMDVSLYYEPKIILKDSKKRRRRFWSWNTKSKDRRIKSCSRFFFFFEREKGKEYRTHRNKICRTTFLESSIVQLATTSIPLVFSTWNKSTFFPPLWNKTVPWKWQLFLYTNRQFL